MYKEMKKHQIDSLVQRSLKRLGRTERWAGYLGGSYETARTIGDYKVEFSTPAEGATQIIIWNRVNPCISIYIADEEAVLNTLRYSPHCTIDGQMKRGEGTKKMLEFAFGLAKEHGAKTVQLQDESTVQCGDETILLGPFYFFQYGTTWYEKHFGFYPIPKYRAEYEHAKELWKKLEIGDVSCLEFTDAKVNRFTFKHFDMLFSPVVWEKTL
jgi:hypothetical protein